jgi:hypothetical protein
MTIQRILAGLVLAMVTIALVVRVTPDALAADTDNPKKGEKRKALLKKLLEEKKAAAANQSNNTPKESTKPPAADATVTTAAKRSENAIDSAGLASLIDREIDKELAAAKLPAAPRCNDSDFIRRASLDIVGVIPTADRVEAFLNDKSPDKRARLVDELLANANYGRRMADVWMLLLYPNESDNRFVNKEPLSKWLHDQFNANTPWDKMVSELLTATGDQEKNGAVTYYMANRGVDKITDSVAKAFLGIQLQCAQCHNHPFTSWKQTEYWGMAQFFMKANATIVRPKKDNGNLSAGVNEIERPIRKFNPLPDSTKTVPAKFLGGEEAKLPKGEPYRPVLAKWATAPENPYFSKAMVNRVWSQFFGRGFVNPVDDMLPENEPSHPALLNELAGQFAVSGFDLKHLIRAICNSQAYQRSSKPLPGNKDDSTLFSHQAVKVLSPEQLFDSLSTVLGGAGPADGRPGKGMGAYRGPRTARDVFVLFFQPGENAKPTEYDEGIPQALKLMNSARLNNSPALVRELGQKGRTPPQIVEKLYLMTVARKPTDPEMRKMTAYVARQPDGASAYSDILWALLNSSEFTMNR